MKISLKWLNDFVDVKDFFQKPEALAEILTKAGLEVEEIQNRSRDYEFVITGLVLEKGKHPNSEKLSVCQVTTGDGVVHQIVCGAQNHKTNDKVIVALPGALLPGNKLIQTTLVRDIESAGMMCSLKELGLASSAALSSEGIEILPENAPIGKSFAQYMGLDDVTFELKVTANRADCLSHYGLAREVACLLGRELQQAFDESKLKLQTDSTQNQIQLENRAIDLAPRYTGRYLCNLKVGPSPEWIKRRLEMVGMKPINNIVDCANYVMMELGQPLHAFDASSIFGKKIIVERAIVAEKFTTLDGTELILTGDELMIKDSERSLCIAGVIGGKNSGVVDTTESVFLEAAFFTPMSARKSLRAHGLNTDSGYRFARGVDPEGTMTALNRVTELILSVAGGNAFGNAHDVYPDMQKKAAVQLKIQTITDRLGYPADPVKFEDFMHRLGCQLQKISDGEYQIIPPSYRFDLEQDMDLVEEYARLNGYDQIPETMPTLSMTPTAHDLNYLLQRRTSEVLRAEGYSQAQNLIFVGTNSQMKFVKEAKILQQVGLPTSEMAVKVLNPLNEEQDSLRMSLSLGLFQNMKSNFNQGNAFGRLFEIGKVFHYQGPGQYQESWRLGISAWGVPTSLWQKGSHHPVVFEIKGAVEAFLRAFHIHSFSWQPLANKGDIPGFLHRGQVTCLVVEGKKVGFLGTVHPVLLEDNKIRVPAALAELDLETLFKSQPRVQKTESLCKFPRIERDLALVLPKSLPVGEVIGTIEKEAGPHLTSVHVFDVYEGEKLEVGQKSVAFRIIYQDKKDTLRDSVVSESVDRVLSTLRSKFQISVR